jgi:hypothetical protein
MDVACIRPYFKVCSFWSFRFVKWPFLCFVIRGTIDLDLYSFELKINVTYRTYPVSPAQNVLDQSTLIHFKVSCFVIICHGDLDILINKQMWQVISSYIRIQFILSINIYSMKILSFSPTMKFAGRNHLVKLTYKV